MNQDSTSNARSPARLLLRLLVVVLVLAGILFGSAGRLDWVEAWLLILVFSGFLIAVLVWIRRHAPDLLEERSQAARNVKRWDLVILRVYGGLLVALLVVAGLDAGRLRWSSMTPALEALGLAGLIASGSVIWWTTTTNPFLSRWARIQSDRGQVVVSDGPYRYVRHPMYAALGPFVVCLAVALGSWMALVPGLLIVALFAVRTILEDRMLHDELPGYREYAARVRHRWLPGVW
jgi:protein-S-isoprenylcysteine O-methyltransferase Ste14